MNSNKQLLVVRTRIALTLLMKPFVSVMMDLGAMRRAMAAPVSSPVNRMTVATLPILHQVQQQLRQPLQQQVEQQVHYLSYYFSHFK